MKKSKIPKLCHNIGLRKLFLDKQLLDFYFMHTATESARRPQISFHRLKTIYYLKTKTPKCTIFPSLFGGEDVYNFPSISYKHRRQSAERLNINHSRLRDEIPAPGSSVTTDTSKAKTINHDDKLMRVSGIFSRPGSVTSSVLTKL